MQADLKAMSERPMLPTLGVAKGKVLDLWAYMPPRMVPETKEQASGTMSKKVEIDVGGKKLVVSNLEKVLYPKPGFTKGQVIDYYVRIAPVLLPHLKNRPITLKRYPEGVEGFFFYEKQCPSHRPEWMKTTEVPSQREAGKIDYCLINDLPALVWAANLADLELHTFLHRAPAIDRPTALAFDLDPGAPADIVLCCEVGLWLRAILDELGLQTFAKTSGSKGLQLFVPLNSPTTYEKTKPAAHALANRLEREHPEQIVSRMLKALRKGKVLIDWSQNDEHKTTVNVYSLRAKERPMVSTPVTWQEVEAVVKSHDPGLLTFDSDTVLRRVQKQGDLFAPVLTLKQRLPSLRSIG
jgi:bifunctional non-homologous end joining protein LigD